MDAAQLPAKESTHLYFQWLQLQALGQSGAQLAFVDRRVWLGEPLNSRNQVQELKVALPCDFFLLRGNSAAFCILLWLHPCLKLIWSSIPHFPPSFGAVMGWCQGGKGVWATMEKITSSCHEQITVAGPDATCSSTAWLPQVAQDLGHLCVPGPQTPLSLPVPECFVRLPGSLHAVGLCCSPSAICWHFASLLPSGSSILSLKHSQLSTHLCLLRFSLLLMHTHLPPP